MVNGTLLEVQAREKAGMPETWRAYRFESFPRTQPTIYYELEGAVVTTKPRGKFKGQPNWKNRDKTTERTVVITTTEHDDWLRAWSKETGKCIECTGTGQTVACISVKSGTTYRNCRVCGGSGAATREE